MRQFSVRWVLFVAIASLLALRASAAISGGATNPFPADVVCRNLGGGAFSYTVQPVAGSPVVWCMRSTSGGVGIPAVGVEAVSSPAGWSARIEEDHVIWFPANTNTNDRTCIDRPLEFAIVSSVQTIVDNNEGFIFGAACGSPSDLFCAAGIQKFHYVGPGIPPLLKIERRGTNSIISWTPALSMYRLETTSKLGSEAVWTRAVAPSGTNRLEVPAEERLGLFRLRRIELQPAQP